MTNTDHECLRCLDYEDTIKDHMQAADELLRLNDEHKDSISRLESELKESQDTISEIKDQAENHSARFSNQLNYALQILVDVNVRNTIAEVSSKPFEDRLETYHEAIDMIFPEEMMAEGFELVDVSEHLMDCEFHLYGTHLDALFDVFHMIDFDDAEFIDAYMAHVKTSQGEYFISEYTDALLLVYILATERTEQWLNEWPKTSYTDSLMKTFDLQLARHSTADNTPLSEPMRQHLRIHDRGKVDFMKTPYQFLFRVLCHNERHFLVTNLLRRAESVDTLFKMNYTNSPEIKHFWEVFAENDDRVASLYPKISEVSLLKGTPLYRRINVLKLNGTLS